MEQAQAMTSNLSSFLREELNRRKWQDSDLADKAGIKRSALSYILNAENVTPKLGTLNQLATALAPNEDARAAWLSRLIEVCGFPLFDDEPTAQLASLLESMPELHGFVEDLSQLRPEHIQQIRSYVAGFLAKQP